MTPILTVSEVQAMFPDKELGHVATDRPGLAIAGVEREPPYDGPVWQEFAVRDPNPLEQQAAMSFFMVAGRMLHTPAAPRPVMSAIGRIVGESPSNFHDALFGQRGGSLDRVSKWIVRWNATGRTPLCLIVAQDCAVVVEAHWCWMRGGPNGDEVAGTGRTLEEAAKDAAADPGDAEELRGALPGKGYGVPVAVGAAETRWREAWAGIAPKRPG